MYFICQNTHEKWSQIIASCVLAFLPSQARAKADENEQKERTSWAAYRKSSPPSPLYLVQHTLFTETEERKLLFLL